MWDIEMFIIIGYSAFTQTDTQITMQSLSKAMFEVHINVQGYTKNHVIMG